MDHVDENGELNRLGHRRFVGGLWEEIGRLQFDFLVSQGLAPEHVLLDIGCGSLRGGVHFIPYLDPGNYLGIDKNAHLIEAGLAELGGSDRRPELIVSEEFEFARFTKRPDYAIAQSLFTHLTLHDIGVCLRRLREAAPACRLYATLFEGPGRENPAASNSRRRFQYPRIQIERLATRSGWRMSYIGEWGHPRGQSMIVMTGVGRPGTKTDQRG